MAEGDAPRWPFPISIDPDQKGYVYITLSVEELAVKAPIIGAVKPVNAEITEDIKADEVTVNVKVTDKSGKVIRYRYHKKLPENIDHEASKLNILKDNEKSPQVSGCKRGRLRLELKKDPDVTWTPHTKYLSCRPESD